MSYKPRASDHICSSLKKMISKGVYSPGDKLPSEHALAKQFGVSRSPIREAISMLVASGIVESVQGGGNYVKEKPLVHQIEQSIMEIATKEEVFNLLEYRMIIEIEVARLAAIRRTDDELKKIKEALYYFKQTMYDEQAIGSKADVQFHLSIAKATHNDFLIETLTKTRQLYEQAIHYSLAFNIGMKRKRQAVYEEHLNIYQAIANQKPEQAYKAMYFHLQQARLKIGDLRVKKLPKMPKEEEINNES